MLFSNITIIDETGEAREHMYLATQGNAIAYIGETPPKEYEGGVYSGNNKVALPGFFNAHCHIPMVLLRGYGEGLPLHRWLQERVFPFEDLLTSEDMYWGTMLGAAELIRSGAVSITDMYMRLGGVCKGIHDAGIKANLSHGATDFSEEARFVDGNGYKDLCVIQDFIKTAGHDRIVADASLHAEYTSQERLVRDVAEHAAQHGMRMHVHISETMGEHEESKARRGGRTPTEWMNHCGVFDVPVTAAHCVWIEGNDYDILAEKGVTVAHCPSSNLKLGSGVANIRKMLDSGVRVAIGTDGASSNNNLNMLEEVNLASLVQKGVMGDPEFLGPKEMLRLACQNGAASQGRADCGSLKVGNRADIVVFDLDRPEMQPVYDVLANVLYAAQADAVTMTMVDGKVLYQDGEYKTIDIEQVKHNADRIKKEKLAALR